MDNCEMDITATIARNLRAWMAAPSTLNTIDKVVTKSGVGFGTVRRARNGDGNTTIQNLTAIARAFDRAPQDLLVGADYATGRTTTDSPARDAAAIPDLIKELVEVAEQLTERGQAELLGRAKEMALTHARPKKNRA